MTQYNEDYHYALEKLKDTVVRLKNGVPVIVEDVILQPKSCEVREIAGGERKYVKLRDMDLRSPPLGYVNYRDTVIYVSRVPKRRDWRQGIRENNVKLTPRLCHFEHLWANNCLTNCIMGKYPSLDDCLKKLDRRNSTGKPSKIAWDRHWAVDSENIVYYKDWGQVGTLRKEDRTMVFDEKFSYLRESFEESTK